MAQGEAGGGRNAAQVRDAQDTQSAANVRNVAERFPIDVQIASPCAARWDDMAGGERVRSCAQCQRKVYNLSEMPTADAANLIRNAEGHLCVRFYRRADGTILTRDCPSGMRAVRQRVARAVMGACAALLVGTGVGLTGRSRTEYPPLLRLLLDRVDPAPALVSTNFTPLPEPLPGTPVTAEHALRVRPSSHFQHTMGKMVMGTPLPLPMAPQTGDKPFLRGMDVANAPREDPFAPQVPKPTSKREGRR